jgi:4-hydroxybenzoate polyprenyltransferase
MNTLGRIYQRVSVLSLDVSLGAVVSALFFARLLNEKLLIQGLLVLGVTVWLIYTADHLLDGWRVKQIAASNRHRFHQKHFRPLLGVLIVLGLIDLYLVLLVRRPILVSGLYFSLAVLVYLLFSKWLIYLKEFTASLLYTAGVLLPSWSMHQTALTAEQWIVTLQFGIVVFINLVLFAWMSLEQDQRDSQESLATLLGKRITRYFLFFLFGLALILFIIFYQRSFQDQSLILIAMTLVLLLIFLQPRFFQKEDRFRWVGDSIFFLPLMVLG